MSRHKNIDEYKTYLFADRNSLPPMTEQKRAYLDRIAGIYLLKLQHPDYLKKEIYNAIVKLHPEVSLPQVYRDIDLVEQIIGDVYSVRKDYQQWLAIQELDFAQQVARRAADLMELKRAQTMQKGALIRSQIAGVNLPDNTLIPHDDIKPNDIEISSDITLTGITEGMDDLEKMKAELRKQYAYKSPKIMYDTTPQQTTNE